MSLLYIVPTPIGNLEDISYRCLSILKQVDYVLAEDTRVTKKIFSKYDISTPLSSFHIYNEIKPLEIGFQDRKDIYQLYPLLVHLVLFGSGYYRNVIRIVQKYS